MKRVHFICILIFISLASNAQYRESWIKNPVDQWPQIALTNNIQFKNGDKYIHPSFEYAGTGFLIYTGKDTFAVTAKHVLLIARNKKSQSVSINNELSLWSMKSKGNMEDSVVIDKLINEDTTEILEGANSTILERDIIVMTIKQGSKKVYPLRPRYTPVKKGEKIYILSCAYNDKACSVNEGTVVNKLGFDILFSTTSPINPGASGSPVIDADGMLVGVFSSLTGYGNKDVAVAISTEYLKDVLGRKPNLNQPRKDYSDMIVEMTLHSGPQAAINEYNRLTSYPHMYYYYNFRSANRNGLREAGEKLLELDQVEDAIEILKFNAEVNSGYFLNFNILAKAYLRSGQKTEAIKAYNVSISKNNDPVINEAFAELKKLQEAGP